MSLAFPDPRTERLADTEANCDGDADDEYDDQDPDNDAVALAHARQAGACVSTLLGGLGFSFPVILAGPNLAVGPSSSALCRP